MLTRFLKILKSSLKKYKKIILILLNIFFIALLSLIIGSILTLSVVADDKLTEHGLMVKLFPVIRALRKSSDIIYLPYYFQKTKLPVYQLEVDPKDLEKLNAALPPAYSDIPLTDEYKERVSAKLYYQNNEYKVKVGYRGLFSSHWSAAKKSWTIKFSADGLLDGRKSVDLILPFDRLWVIEHLNNYRAKKLGIMAPESRYVRLVVNGKNYGVYFEVNGWEPEMLEKDTERSGDSDLYGFIYNPNLKTYETVGTWKKYTENIIEPTDFSNLAKLVEIVNIPDDNKFYTQIGSIINLDKFYRWQITHLLMNDSHLNDTNVKLYFNNASGLFEYVSWDISQSTIPYETIDNNLSDLATRILTNPIFIQERNKILWEYVKDDKNLEDDLNFINAAYNLIRVDVYRDRLKVKSNLQFDQEVKLRKQIYADSYQRIQSALKTSNIFANIYLNPADAAPTLYWTVKLDINSFANVFFQSLDLNIKGDGVPQNFYLYQDANGNQKFDASDLKIANIAYDSFSKKLKASPFNLELYSSRVPENELLPVKTNSYYFFITSDVPNRPTITINEARLGVVNSLTGQPAAPTINFINESAFYYFDQINESIDNFIGRYHFIKKVAENTAKIYAGTHLISENIIVPKGVALEIDPGVILKFSPKISLISYGKIIASGTAEQPIIFSAADDAPWGNVVAINDSAKDSVFNWCKFDFGSDSTFNGVYASGMLSLYNVANARVSNCEFTRAQADDALNVKYGSTELTVKNNYFSENSSDAIDFDWTDGLIDSNYFYQNGGDAIDISGRTPKIFSNVVNGSGDKCLSLGEQTYAIVVNNLLSGCLYGIAVKDLSEVQIINNTIVNNEIGLGAYEKKPIFGGGFPAVVNTIIWDNKQQITLDAKSKIDLSYSNIAGGYKGKNNLNLRPNFIDANNFNYLLSDNPENEKLLKGSQEALKDWNQNLVNPPLGIYSLIQY